MRAAAKKDIRSKIDEAGKLQEEVLKKVKQFEETIAPIVLKREVLFSEVLQHLKAGGIVAIDAKEFTAEGKSSTSTHINPKKLADLLKKMDKGKQFFDLVKVKMTETKKMIGESALKEIWEKTTETYTKVVIKRRK